MRFAICLLICAAGCGGPALSPEQIIVRTKVYEWVNSPADVTFLKWWPAVSAEKADLPKLLATAEANRPPVGTVDMDWEWTQIMKIQYDQEQPSHLVRLEYRLKNKEGVTETKDQIFNIKGDKVVGVWFPPSKDTKQAWLAQWLQQMFP